MVRLEKTAGADTDIAFAAAGEALWWAIVLDHYFEQQADLPNYRARRDADPRGELLRGVRYARNAVGHHVAAVELVEGRDIYTGTYSDIYGEWCWRPLKSKAVGRDTYNHRMEGRAARETLRELMPFFEQIVREIEEPSL